MPRDPVEDRETPFRDAASYNPGGSVWGMPLMAPDLKEVSRCMAIINSVESRAPRCWVSDKFHIRPKVSFGNLARSNICFAVSPSDVTMQAQHPGCHHT